MYKAIIIDDEPMARMLLAQMIAQYCPQITVVDECTDLPQGVKAICKHKPNLVFLDIEMPGHSGLELLDFFDENDIAFSIIFTTAYHHYAIQAFKLSAVDYLLKPIDAEDLKHAVSIFEKQQTFQTYQSLKENLTSPNKKIALSTTHSILFIPLTEILFFKANGSYTTVYLESRKEIMTSKNLKHYEDIIGTNMDFFRCHKSYIINLNKITEYVKSEGGYLKVGSHQVNITSDKIPTLLYRLKI